MNESQMVPSFEMEVSLNRGATIAIQGHQDISDMFAWMQPMRCANYAKGLSKLAAEIQEKTQEWHAYLGGRCSRKESLEAISGEEVPPKDFSHGAEAASLLVRLVRALPRGFLLCTMLEPLVQELLEAIFCDWPRTLPSLQDLKESEVTCERLGQLSTYAQLISGLRANLQVAQKATEEMKQKESTASMLAKTKSRAYEELRVQVRRLEDERDQSRVAKDVAQKQCAEAEEFFEVFKQQTKLALNDYGEMQYREATIRSDLNNLQVHCKEKDLLISELRNQTTALTHETHELEEKLLKVREEMERRTADVELLPELYKKLQYYESEEAVHGVEFARRVVDEVLGKSMEELTGRLPSSMPMEKRTQICMDSVVDHLVSAMRDAEKLKEQVLKTQQLLEEVKQLVPIWNEHTMQDVVEAYDEDAAVHRQIFSMNDKRSFAGLGLDESVPPYLRAEGFVRHRYMSKKECEDIMEAFHAEASGDLNTSSLHAELHQYLQRRFVEPEEFTEFAYAFICSLEAYRDDPDFELFDLMLAGAVHPSIMQDQETMLRELQTLVHSCADGGIENHSRHNHRGQRMTGNGKNFGARDQVTRRVMRAVMQAMFPEKSVDRMNCLMKALHQTLQMLFDAGRSSNPDAAFVSDLFSATADGTQSPLIEEMRRQHVHEVLEFTAEISHQLIRRAGGESYVNLHGRLDPHILIQREDTIFVLDKNFPEIKSTAMLESAWKLGDEGPQQVADVLQTFRNNFLLKRENAWVVVGPKAVVEKAVELAPGKLSKDGTKLEDSKVAQRNRALKVLDNPYSRDEGYTPQQLLKETRRVPRKFDEDMPEVED